MSNFDQVWNEQQRMQARSEGWELGVVVDAGRPITSAYLDCFDVGPKFVGRRAALQWVITRAQQRSKLHVDALAACGASKTSAGAPSAPRKRASDV